MTQDQIDNLKHFEPGEYLYDGHYRKLHLMGHDTVCGVLDHYTDFGMDFIGVRQPCRDGSLGPYVLYSYGAVYSVELADRHCAARLNGFTRVNLYIVCRTTGDVVLSGEDCECLALESMEDEYGSDWDDHYWLLTEPPTWVESQNLESDTEVWDQ